MQDTPQLAYLLHSRPFQDDKVICELLTQDYGKVAVVAYQGKSAKSNKRALLQPFTPITVTIKGKSQLKTASRIESAGKSWLLTGDYLYSGMYLNELQVKLLGEYIPVPDLFEQYKVSIEGLEQQRPIEPILRQFENSLLEELGFGIDYSVLTSFEEGICQYIPEQGFVPVNIKSKAPVLNVAHLLSIWHGHIDNAEVLYHYKLLMRQIIQHLLAGKPLNSRQFFAK